MKYRIEQLGGQIVRLANSALRTRVEIPDDMLVTVIACVFSKDRSEAILTVSVFPDTKRGTGLALARSIVGFVRTSLGALYSLKRIPSISVRLADDESRRQQTE